MRQEKVLVNRQHRDGQRARQVAAFNHLGGLVGRTLLIVAAVLALISVSAAVYFAFFEAR